jgi:uncharacterized protein (TIGR02099 family)
MNPLPLPSKLLKTWSAVTRWLLSVVIFAWLVLGIIWGSLHWIIVPRIGEYRPQLEALATRALGVPVRVGAVMARSSGMLPSFELQDVSLLDAQGRVALSLPRVVVVVSPRSLWRMGFEQVLVDQPKLDIRRLADGRVTVAGLEVMGTGGVDSAGLDWFFSQIEFVITDGAVRWTDELRGNEPIVLQNVNALARNLGRHHDLRLDATPPEAWGERFAVQGKFTQALLTRRNGQWQEWDGQLYARFDRVDLSQLRQYVNLGVAVSQGQGAVRAWMDVIQGRVTGAMADLALNALDVTLGKDLQALSLQGVQGRLGGRLLAQGFELTTKSLVFATADGLHWPGGDTRLLVMEGEGKIAPRGEFQAEKLDVTALADVLKRLPLAPSWREALVNYAPKGIAEKLDITWVGSANSLQSYAAKGRLSQIGLRAVGQAPGVRGLGLDFKFDQLAGQARVWLDQGSVEVPGMFDEPVIDVAQLSAQARWTVDGERVTVDVSELSFGNADAQGQGRIKWESSDPQLAGDHSRFPGVLDLQVSLSRAEGKRVYRYLPRVIDQAARDYVRNAVQGGSASNVRFAIKGEINQLPLGKSKQDSFRISADVRDATLAFVPRSLQAPRELPWPSLTGLSGELVIDRLQLQVNAAKAKSAELPRLLVTAVDVLIPDLKKTEVKVNGAIKGPLADAFKLMNSTALSPLIGDALAAANGNGEADIKLALNLPIADLNKSTVRGSVSVAGNDLQISQNSPKLSRARGVVNFTESGLSLSGVQARLLGGDAQLDGGLVFDPASPSARGKPETIRVRGNATAEGLRQANELGFIARLARHASGGAAYTAALGVRQGEPELLVQSNLQGLALTLPAPLQKLASSDLALRLQTQVVPGSGSGLAAAASTVGAAAPTSPLSDRISLSLGQSVNLMYERDISAAQARVLRGALAVGLEGPETVTLPPRGVAANIKLAQLNVDAWQEVLDKAINPAGGNAGGGLADTAAGAAGHPGLGYLPTTWALRADTLALGGRTFHRVVAGGGREGGVWQTNLYADELNGYLEYRQSAQAAATSAGRVYARLARLTIAPTTASEVETFLDAQPVSIPALDIVVDEFDLGGKALGRLEVEAINRAAINIGDLPVREWRLNKFNLTVPEAKFTANGNWARLNAQGATETPSDRALPGRRRTVLNFKLDMTDGGALLARFGMNGVVRQASGKLEGQIAWLGSPLKVDYPTLGGAFTVNVAAGQFLKADPGIAKLLGVLSLQSLPRRLTLDFRDVFSDGFAFDFLRGDVTVSEGIARTNNLQMKGVNAAVLMEGQADVARETQNLKVVVVPEINAGTASLIATVINPAIGLGTVLAQLFLRRPLIESNTQEFRVDGSWADPKVTRVPHTPSANKETPP